MPAPLPKTRTLLTTRRHWQKRVSVRRRASGRVHHNYFRDLDPATGRYIASDPIGLRGGPSTYSYVGGNPAMLSDSRGLLSDNECCARSQELGQNRSPASLGWVICCEGRKVACVAKLNDVSKAWGIISKCIGEHEKSHLPEISCPNCSREPERPQRSGNNTWDDYNKSECRGGRIELACLRRRLGECGTDLTCRATVQGEISKLQHYYRKCGGGI